MEVPLCLEISIPMWDLIALTTNDRWMEPWQVGAEYLLGNLAFCSHSATVFCFESTTKLWFEMDSRGCSGAQGDGNFCFGSPHGGRGAFAKWGRDGLKGRGPPGGGCCSLQSEDMCGAFVDLENAGHSVKLENFGHGKERKNCCNHDRVAFAQDKEMNCNHEPDDEVLDRLQELEMQVKMIRSENLESKNVILRLYNLVSTSVCEARAQQSALSGKIEHLEAFLGLVFSRRARNREVTVGELDEINRNITKLQKYMEGNGNYVDLSAEKSRAEEPVEAAKNIGHK